MFDEFTLQTDGCPQSDHHSAGTMPVQMPMVARCQHREPNSGLALCRAKTPEQAGRYCHCSPESASVGGSELESVSDKGVFCTAGLVFGPSQRILPRSIPLPQCARSPPA